MIKTMLIAAVLLVISLAAAFPQVGAGLTVAYPIGAAVMYSDIYGGRLHPMPLFVGPSVRWRYSLLYIDAAARYWPHGGMLHGNLNLGVCGDLAFLRFGLSGGIDGILMPLPGSEAVFKHGWNLKLDIDVHVWRISAGLSVAFPMDLLFNLQDYGYALVEPYDELRTYSGQVSATLIYWFGPPRKTTYRGRIR